MAEAMLLRLPWRLLVRRAAEGGGDVTAGASAETTSLSSPGPQGTEGSPLGQPRETSHPAFWAPIHDTPVAAAPGRPAVPDRLRLQGRVRPLETIAKKGEVHLQTLLGVALPRLGTHKPAGRRHLCFTVRKSPGIPKSPLRGRLQRAGHCSPAGRARDILH